MKIKRIDIMGFKSFVDKVSLDFPPGVTAIVGPNGCGKSNIVDAIRWVMGEQSAKNLRGRQMEDVIFGGSETRRPLGMAEVSLVFSTDDGRVPAKYLNYSEIQVTRRLYRDGESEYLLNKTPCRLMDIAELFMDTGVGTKAYSIIEQGKIGMILLSKPEERRFLIEEAAGVTKFKTRKQVALKKIDLTRQNLVRIGDIVSEIKRQLNSLQRQAKKAERFREHREELKEIELTMAARGFAALAGERTAAATLLRQAEVESAALATRLEEAELRLEVKRLTLVEKEKGVAAAQEEIFLLRGEATSLESRLEFQRRELANLDRHRLRFEEELAGLKPRLEEALKELDASRVQLDLAAVELGEEEERLSREELSLEDAAGGEAELTRSLEGKRHELFSLLSEIAQFSNHYTSTARRLESMAERYERNRREEVMLREELAGAAARIGQIEQALGQLQLVCEETARALSEEAAREATLKEESAALERRLQETRQRLSAAASRLRSLQELEAQFAGYGSGIRNLLSSDRFRGRFQGMVADAVETDEEFEAAVEAVLGERLQYLLSSGIEDVVDAIAYLKENSGGRCSFITGGITGADRNAPHGAVSILDKVRIAPDHHRMVTPLLAGAYLASDLQAAISYGGEFPGLTFVTPQGELVHSAGVVQGGSPEGAGHGVIHKKREIRELNRETESLGQEVGGLEEARARIVAEFAHAEESLREMGQRLHRTELEAANTGKDLQMARDTARRLEERLELKRLEEEQFQEEREALEGEMTDSGLKRGAAEERKAVLEMEVASLQESLNVSRRQLGEMRDHVTAAKVKVAALREKRESVRRAEARGGELIRELQARIGRCQSELEKGTDEESGVSEAILRDDKALKEALLRQSEAEKTFAGIREGYDREVAALQEEETALKGLRGSWEESRKNESDLGLRLSELNMKLELLENTVRERFRVELSALPPVYSQGPWDEEAGKRRQGELQRFIDDMGEVNLMAIEEFRQLEERYDFLCAQRDDLEESLHGLQQAIQRINRTTRKRFLETFHLVNDKFREVFPRLFCGGSAELRLTDEDNLLETGIDIVVQPPGKKLQNVSLLSGGEKALTAVALIFSIFLIKPSPFCLLDEVDAPLDDANIGRFNDMIREMSDVSQFIVITHNKTTMGVADTLFGVTMEEPGVSKLVSVKLN